jgi:hypothetical protein
VASTNANPQPLTPGEVYEFEIEVLPVSTRSERATASGWRLPMAI